MSVDLFERYKEALRRGHIAALAGELETALACYSEAAAIAPERALPYTSRGAVFLRLGRPVEAGEAFDAGLERGPTDAAALAGRAEAFIQTGRPADAAGLLDRLAAVRSAAGQHVEALDAARRALELAESKSRRRDVRRLADIVRASAPDREAETILADALRILDASEAAIVEAAQPESSEAVKGSVLEPLETAEEPGPELEPEPEPEAPDPLAMTADAEAALDAGDASLARDLFLRLAQVHATLGQRDAALDACYRALAVAPDDRLLHLFLVELYLERGWEPLATEKLALLERVAALDGDTAGVELVRQVRAGAARTPAD